MSRPPPLLLILLLPLLGVAFAAVSITLLTLHQVKGEQASALAAERQAVALLNEATLLNAEMASVQQRIGEVLKQADAGRMDEAAVYQEHSRVVDTLDALNRRVGLMTAQARALTGDAQHGTRLLEEFDAYRHAVIQATDIAAVDPQRAGEHIASAQRRFIAVSEQAHRIGHELGRRLQQQGDEAARGFEQRFRETTALALAGLLLMSGLAVLGVRHLTRRMTRIVDAMSTLAQAQAEPPPLPAIEAMTRNDRSAFGTLAGAVLSFRHALVEEHQAKAALLAQQQDLEAQVEARTADLREARDQAEAAARVKSDFLSVMSHEIRTPMNSVIGMTHLALRADPNPRVAECLRKIQASGQHLLGIINDILDYSKLDAHKLRLEQADFDLDALLDQVVDQIAEKASSKSLTLTVARGPGVPRRLRGDALRLQQVLLNYTSNALKFTERGGIRIEVAQEPSLPGGLGLRFSVHDTGIGISPDQQERLFQSFEQADSSITRRYGGTGLGLAICKRLAELMGGQVGMDSVPGRGSSFWFTAVLQPAAQAAAAPEDGPDLQGLRVLVLDDNDAAREVITALLQGHGMQATAVADGPAALQALQDAERRGQPFPLALIDWKMPGLDGIAVARAIQALSLASPPELLLMTAYDRDEALAMIHAAGLGAVQQVLVKPLGPRRLLEAIRLQLAGTHLRPAAADASTGTEVGALVGARALLVEDNDINQEVARALMSELGLVVDVAGNGAEALDKIEAGDYDIVLMDMQMPVMDGLTATRRIREQPRLRELPIVAMTANALAADRQQCLDAGMNDHLAKPIEPPQLRDTLQRWLAPRPRPALPEDLPAGRERAADEATATLDALAQVPGLDVRLGLRLCTGRPALYLSLLKRFPGAHRDTPAHIRQALAQGRHADAERLAHSLKGVAAQIGATEVRDQAAALELQIRSTAPEIERATTLEALASRVAALAAALAFTLAGAPDATGEATGGAPGGSANEPPPDVAAWPAVRAELHSLLAQDDAQALRVLEAHEGVVRAGLGPRYAAFAQAMRRFDLPRALELLLEG